MAVSSPALLQAEKNIVASLAGVFALRMFGLFMLLPVFSLLAEQVEGATPALIGTAIGIYGLMQALLQIPFGVLSDKFGRRPLLLMGIVLFVLGGAVAALSSTIYGVILGRALQGAGAIASVVMALASDVVPERHRTRAMAFIGVSVGGSFVLALILGPVLAGWLGLSGLFWLTSILGVFAFIIVLRMPVGSVQAQADLLGWQQQAQRVLLNTSLLRLNMGIFTLHLIMTAAFVVLPVMLKDQLGMPVSNHSLLYLAVLLLGVIGMVPLIILSERKGAKPVMAFAVLLLMVTMCLLAYVQPQLWQFVLVLSLFFVAFNLLEAQLPSLVSSAAPAGTKGASMGVYSSSQFMGVFVGGQLGGWMLSNEDAQSVFLVCAAVAALWWLLVLTMKPLSKQEGREVNFKPELQEHQVSEELLKVAGVEEVVVLFEQGVALLKVNPKEVDDVALSHLIIDDAQPQQS